MNTFKMGFNGEKVHNTCISEKFKGRLDEKASAIIYNGTITFIILFCNITVRGESGYFANNDVQIGLLKKYYPEKKT